LWLALSQKSNIAVTIDGYVSICKTYVDLYENADFSILIKIGADSILRRVESVDVSGIDDIGVWRYPINIDL
jgi:hypothetical protein